LEFQGAQSFKQASAMRFTQTLKAPKQRQGQPIPQSTRSRRVRLSESVLRWLFVKDQVQAWLTSNLSSR
jgi:hypothetical protein